MNLEISENTAITVRYSANSEEYVFSVHGRTIVGRRALVVLFDGPVQDTESGHSYDTQANFTVHRTDDGRSWNAELGTPFDIDKYINERDVPEECIPEAVIQAVDRFIEEFE